MKLSDKSCKNAKAKEKPYKLFDGGGLFLEVMPNNSKLWRLKYRCLGKEKRISLGAYPIASLADARDGRDKAKKLLVQGIDPSGAKQDQKKEAVRNAENTFKAVALEWHENQLARWTPHHALNVMRRFDVDIFPYIGSRPIAEIDPPELLEVLRRIEKRGALDVTARVKQIAGQVFRYGIATGRCQRDPSAAPASSSNPTARKRRGYNLPRSLGMSACREDSVPERSLFPDNIGEDQLHAPGFAPPPPRSKPPARQSAQRK